MASRRFYLDGFPKFADALIGSIPIDLRSFAFVHNWRWSEKFDHF